MLLEAELGSTGDRSAQVRGRRDLDQPQEQTGNHDDDNNDQYDNQSHKSPVSVSAMLTGKFLQIRKVFATSSLLAEEFPDTLQYKISR